MTNCYANLTTLKARLGITGTGDDTTLRLLLEAASRIVDKHCGRWFYVLSATRYYDGDSVLYLPDDLLSVTTLKTDEDGDATFENTFAVTDYLLYHDVGQFNGFPKTLIRISHDSDYGGFAAGIRKGVEIAGVFGYGDGDSATPYLANTTIAEDLTAGETDITVTSAANLSAGDTILIDSEQMYITGIAAAVLTVECGVNGTTEAAHTNGATLSLYRYPSTVKEATILTTSRIWKRRDSSYATFVASPELGGFEVFRGLDPDVKLMLEPLRRLHA